MAGKRDRIVEIKDYLESLDICVNIGKNKAFGNKGILKKKDNCFRIDISKNLSEDEIIRVFVHEFAHYVHCCYDTKLMSLDFAFDNMSESIEEELISITVNGIPKDFAVSLLEQKALLNKDIKELSKAIKTVYSDFKQSQPYKPFERSISKPAIYLLKYDKVKVFNQIYSLESLNDFTDLSLEQRLYINLKSKQRMMKKVNAKISRLNKYYNSKTELFARFMEEFILNPKKARETAPISFDCMEKNIKGNKIPILSEFLKIFTA